MARFYRALGLSSLSTDVGPNLKGPIKRQQLRFPKQADLMPKPVVLQSTEDAFTSFTDWTSILRTELREAYFLRKRVWTFASGL